MNRLLQLFFSLIKLVSVPLFNFFTLFLGIYFYGKENWGEFISISIWIYFISFIAKWSGQNYLVKEMSKNTSNYLSVFYTNILERSILLLPILLFFYTYSFTIALSSTAFLVLIFIYTSYDALIVYKQKLQFQFLAEVTGILVLVLGFLFLKNYNTVSILLLFALSFLIKTIVLLLAFKHTSNAITIRFSTKRLIQTLPYFLIGLSGWLNSKSDVYVVAYYFDKKLISEYQGYASCFLILQAIPAYLTMPINLHMFRLSENTIETIKKKMVLLALPIITICTLIIRFGLSHFMKIEFPFVMYMISALASFPVFLYTIDTLQLIRYNKEKQIMIYSFITAFLNLMLMILLTPYFKIQGVVIAICISQWVYLLLINKKLLPKIFSPE